MPNGTNIVRVPKVGSLDITLFEDPARGRQVTSQKFGTIDFLHHCNGGANHIYLDPDTHQALLDSGARAGDAVRFTRMRRGDANYIEVQLLSDAQEPAPAPTPTPFSARLRSASRPTPPPVVMGAAARELQPAPQFQAQPPRPGATHLNALSQQVAGILRMTLDGFKEAQAYADEIQSGIRFTEANVTSFAISVFIEARRSGK